MTNQQALTAIYNAFNNGVQYGKFKYWDYYNNRPFSNPYFHIMLCKHWCKNIFCWENFGSSANKATKKDLAWIIKEIFKTTPEKFLIEYMTNTEYERIQIAMHQHKPPNLY